MAQPLAQNELAQNEHPTAVSSIDEAATRLDLAFQRLIASVEHARAGTHSLKADQEKLNHLLHVAQGETAKIKEVAKLVTKRLDSTIATLEKEA